MTDMELMRLHVQTLFTRDDAGRLVSINEPRGAQASRFFLGRTAEGNAWWFRNDLSSTLVNELSALCATLPVGLDGAATIDVAPFIACLSRAEPVHKTDSGPTFYFPSDLTRSEGVVRVTADNISVLSPYFGDWRNDVSPNVAMIVALANGKAVSVCYSARAASLAHEAGVETHRDFRGRGYAARATNAWAHAVREMDRIPLYSTSWENVASRALAKKLGLIQYGVTLHVT